MAANHKRLVLYENISVDLSELPGTLAEVVNVLHAKLMEIPEEYRGSATFDTDDDYETGFSRYAHIHWQHNETDEEMAARVAEEERLVAAASAKNAARDLARAAAAEVRDKAEYERLKAKFGE